MCSNDVRYFYKIIAIWELVIMYYSLIFRLDLSSCGFWILNWLLVRYRKKQCGSGIGLHETWFGQLTFKRRPASYSSRRDLTIAYRTVGNHGLDSLIWSHGHSSSGPNDVTIVRSYSACRLIGPVVLSNPVKPILCCSLLDSKGQQRILHTDWLNFFILELDYLSFLSLHYLLSKRVGLENSLFCS